MTDTTRLRPGHHLGRSAHHRLGRGTRGAAGRPREGREGPVARYRRLGGAPPSADVLDLGGVDRVLCPDGRVSPVVHQRRPIPRRPVQGPGGALGRRLVRSGQPGLRRLRPHHLRGPSLDPGRRVRHVVRGSARLVRRHHRRLPSRLDRIRCSVALARSSSASRCCWAGSCSSTSSPATR